MANTTTISKLSNGSVLIDNNGRFYTLNPRFGCLKGADNVKIINEKLTPIDTFFVDDVLKVIREDLTEISISTIDVLFSELSKHFFLFSDKNVLTEKNIIIEYFLNGTSPNLNVNGAVTPVVFSKIPAAGKSFHIARIILFIETESPILPNKLGDLLTLTNGISIIANGVEIDNWKDNEDIITSMYDVNRGYDVSGNLTSFAARLSFTKFDNVHGLLIDDETNGFQVKVQDNLSGLTSLRIKMEGIELNS